MREPLRTALVHHELSELQLRGIPVEREVPFDVRYKGHVVGKS